MTATILPNAKSQFIDSNGKPLAGGTVYFYIPNTSTPKATWQDPAQTILNTQPIVLDASGQALIWGSGVYRQVVYDQFGNLIWDQITEDANVGLTGNLVDDIFVAGTDFTPGTTTQLTLTADAGTITNTWIFFDGTYQADSTITSLNGTTLTFNSPIPVGVTTVTVKIGMTVAVGIPANGSVTDATVAAGANIDSSKLSFLQAGAGAVRRTVQSKERDIVSVKDFGAKGDGTTDDTASINSADTYARSIGARVYFPGAGPYMVSQIVLDSGSYWFGDRNTVIKSIIGSNKDVIFGANSAANWGQADPSPFVNMWTLESLTIDGNWNAGSGNTVGGGIAVFGAAPIMRDVYIRNCAGHGLRTEYPPSGRAWVTSTVEGEFDNIKIDTCGQRGWWYNGPNDSVIKSTVVVDAGQAANNTWDAFYFDANGIARCYGLHAWNRQASQRHQYGLNLRPGAESEFIDCQFEGAWAANVGLFSQRCKFDSTCNYFSAWNGINIYMGLTASLNQIRGTLDGPGAGRPAVVGIVMGSAAGDSIGSNDIDVMCIDQEAANIEFTAYDAAANKIRMNCFNSTATTYVGMPNTNDDIDILFQNPGTGISHLNNRKQTTLLTLPASGSVTWTFPIPFTISPVVTYSIQGPSGSAANGTWITSISPTSVTIFNNTTASMTLDALAIARD